MDEQISLQKLVQLRKATRVVADMLRSQLKEYFTVLGPLLRPKSALGDYVSGGPKESPAYADKAFAEVQAIFARFAAEKPFRLDAELPSPMEISHTPIEIQTYEYAYTAQSDSGSKTVRVVSPLKWVISYPGYTLSALSELLAQKSPPEETLRRFATHAAVLHYMIFRQPALPKMFAVLRYPINAGQLPEFGGLPIVSVFSAVPTIRPPDDVIIDSTEISGTSLFEEVVDPEAVNSLRDPLREELLSAIA